MATVFVATLAGETVAPYLTLPLGQGVNSLQVTVAPDGRSLVAAVPPSAADVWLVENFDPRCGQTA